MQRTSFPPPLTPDDPARSERRRGGKTELLGESSAESSLSGGGVDVEGGRSTRWTSTAVAARGVERGAGEAVHRRVLVPVPGAVADRPRPCTTS